MVDQRKYLIIQAGGKGTRLRPYTLNRPKCLVNVGGKTILTRAVEMFPNHKIIVIGDYLFDTLRNYRDVFYPDIELVATDEIGTSSGIQQSLKYIPENFPVTIMWSDLLFTRPVDIDYEKNIIGLSRTFDCRYQYRDRQIVRETSNASGIAGYFSFINKGFLADVPRSGSLVSTWMRKKLSLFDDILWLDFAHEIGTCDSLHAFESLRERSRFFNSVVRDGNEIIKTSIDKKYKSLLKRESRWYDDVKKISTNINIPEHHYVKEEDKLILEYIDGTCPSRLGGMERHRALESACQELTNIHQIRKEPDKELLDLMYTRKTLNRVQPYHRLLSQYDKRLIKINGTFYQNPFCESGGLTNKYKRSLLSLGCDFFTPIHGDPTFSNMIWDGENVWLIDPRGSFGNEEYSLYGDPRYDWAKLYYSAIDNYDEINSRNFKIEYGPEEIKIIATRHGDDIFWRHCQHERKSILLILSTIWFSLVGYVIEDLDAMNFAFAKGILTYHEYLEEMRNE
jgi:thiamine kinase-like enzyme/GTP:adenosylcobinamide-phosphate guanylyltransferase